MAEYNSAYTGQQIDGAVGAVIENKSKWDNGMLPPVTTSDDGKFLKVVEGAWKANEVLPSDIGAVAEDEIADAVMLRMYPKAVVPRNKRWASVGYGNGRFVAIPRAQNPAIYSDDGITWNSVTLPSTVVPGRIAYGNGRFVFGSASTVPLYSDDGITWTLATTQTGATVGNHVIFADGKFVSVGTSGLAGYSIDGETWDKISLPNSMGAYDIAYGAGKFVAIGGAGASAYSQDGVSWTKSAMPDTTRSWDAIAYGAGKFIALSSGSSTAAVSEDGVSWTSHSVANGENSASRAWRKIIFVNDTFYCLGSDKIVTTQDGISWNIDDNKIGTNTMDFAFGDGMFVAVSLLGATSFYSYDGTYWFGSSDTIALAKKSKADVTKDAYTALLPYIALSDIGAAAESPSHQVTLTASGWNSTTKQQTVTCADILADVTKQEIHAMPVDTSAGNAYYAAGIMPVAQAANSLTFYAETVPTEDINVYVAIHPLKFS